MIVDCLENAARYESLNPHFAAAFKFLREADPSQMVPGRHEVDGDRLYVIHDLKDGRGRGGARLETHRKYIDIQFTVGGADDIGWLPAAECRQVAAAYDPAKDIARFGDAPSSWVTVPEGVFAIFWPEDGHAPLGGEGPIRKLIAKVAVEG